MKTEWKRTEDIESLALALEIAFDAWMHGAIEVMISKETVIRLPYGEPTYTEVVWNVDACYYVQLSPTTPNWENTIESFFCRN